MKRLAINEPKTECFAYRDKGTPSCRALTELVCIYEKKCPFYRHNSEINYTEIERAVKNYTPPTIIK